MCKEHFNDRNTDIVSQPILPPANCLYQVKQRKNWRACQKESTCDSNGNVSRDWSRVLCSPRKVCACWVCCPKWWISSWCSGWWVMKVGFFTLSGNKMAWNGITQYCPGRRSWNDALSPWDHGNCLLGCWRMHVGQVFATAGNVSAASDTPEASLCCAWQMSREEEYHPATWQHMAPHSSSVHGEDSEEWLGTSPCHPP